MHLEGVLRQCGELVDSGLGAAIWSARRQLLERSLSPILARVSFKGGLNSFHSVVPETIIDARKNGQKSALTCIVSGTLLNAATVLGSSRCSRLAL